MAAISFIRTPVALGRRHGSPDKDGTASITRGAGTAVMDGEVIKGKCRQILQTQTNRKKPTITKKRGIIRNAIKAADEFTA